MSDEKYKKFTDEEMDAIVDYIIAGAPRTATVEVDPETGRVRVEFPKVGDPETH